MSRPSAPEHRTEAGFSLVEVLCALVITATAMVVLFRGLGGSQLTAIYLDSHLGARLLAQTILEDERSSDITEPGTRSGDSGIYQWQLTIAPAAIGTLEQSSSNFRPYRLSVDIQWQPRGRLQLDTLKLGRQ